MPWKIEQRGGQYCVVKSTDGSTEKCHDVKADAEAHLKALYASEPKAAANEEVAAAQPELPGIAEPASTAGTPFNVLLMVEGLETSDGRMFELGTTTWRDLPIPFMVQDTTPHGPGQTPAPAWAAGQIDEWVGRDTGDPSRILGRGHLMPNDAGQRAEQLARHGFRGVSVDAYGLSPVPPELQMTAVDQNGEPLDVLVRYSDSAISRATMVPTPAFESCCIWFDDEPMPDIAANAHGAIISTDTEPVAYEIADPYEQLVASAGGPVTPPRSWFFTPEPNEFQPWQVSADGHITGHIAREGQCHLGIVGRCQTAPMSSTVPPYKAFHRTTARCDDDTEVACGWLTVGTKHDWNMRAPAEETADHYDHTGTLAAKIRLSNGRHGIWASGALCPGLADRDVWILQGPEVSPDWRRWQDPDTGQWHSLELVATLAVPFPGYPHTRTRPELLVASGEIVAMHGSIDPCDCDEGEPMTPEEHAAIEARFATLEANHAELVGALVAAGAMPAPAADTPIELAAAHAFVDKNGDGKCDVCGLAEEMHAKTPAAAAADNDDVLAETGDEPITMADLDEIEPLTIQERARWFGKYTADQKRQMAKDGKAMGSDGSFPIGDEEDLKNAIRAVGRASGDKDGVRRHILRNAKRMNKADLIPDTWQADGSLKAAALLETAS